eukprot:jgi/Psemu1/286180/fgenesh1_pg.123_\
MSHWSNPQAQRTIKFVTAVACTGVGIQSTFFSNYDHVPGMEGKDHVFSHLQREAHKMWDQTLYGINHVGDDDDENETAVVSGGSGKKKKGSSGHNERADPSE